MRPKQELMFRKAAVRKGEEDVLVVPQPRTEKKLDSCELHNLYGSGLKLLKRLGYTEGEALRKGALATPLSHDQSLDQPNASTSESRHERAVFEQVLVDTIQASLDHFGRGLFVQQLFDVAKHDPRVRPSFDFTRGAVRAFVIENPETFTLKGDYVTLVKDLYSCEYCSFRGSSKAEVQLHAYNALHREDVRKLEGLKGCFCCRFCSASGFGTGLGLVQHTKEFRDHAQSGFGPALLHHLTSEETREDWLRAAENSGIPFDWRAFDVVVLDEEEPDIIDLDEDLADDLS